MGKNDTKGNASRPMASQSAIVTEPIPGGLKVTPESQKAPPPRTCGTCRFFRKRKPAPGGIMPGIPDGSGECTFNPPTIVQVHGGGIFHPASYIHPARFESDPACGRYAPRLD